MILKSKSRVSPDSEGWTLEILRERNAENFPRWPNESMVKTLFGSYLREPISPLPSWKILDVGCGFANNLIPFAELGCKCFAVDLSEDMLQVARQVLGSGGYGAEFHVGHNRSLPFPDEYLGLMQVSPKPASDPSLCAVSYDNDL